MLEAQEFVIRTDHKPLIYAFRQRANKASPRQLRQLDFIGQFSTNLVHVAGDDNTVADTLSRINEIATPTVIEPDELANEQENDAELQALLNSKTTALKLKKLTPTGTDTAIWCDVSTNNIRPYVPPRFRREIFNRYHEYAHPSGRATYKLVRNRFVWPVMERSIKEWARTCVPCQKSKVSRHTKAPFNFFDPAEQRFEHVHVDIVGPLPPCQGFRYCLTMSDRFTRWPEVAAMADISADTVVKTFYAAWIARFGCPRRITTDQGRQFEATLTAALTNLLGIKRCRTTAYRPQSNGFIERWHRTIKAAIKCHEEDNWCDLLPTVLLGLRTAVKEDLQCSPAQLTYGTQLRIPGEFFFTGDDVSADPASFVNRLQTHMRQLRPTPTSHHDSRRTFVHPELSTCSHVFLRDDAVKRPLQQPYSGPHQVLERNSKTFKIVVNAKPVTVNIDRLKPAFLPQETERNSPTIAVKTSQKTSSRGRRLEQPVRFRDYTR